MHLALEKSSTRRDSPGTALKTGLLLAIFFALSACDGGSGEKDSNPLHLPPQGFIGDSIIGESLYSQNCLACHGIGGMGTNQGPPLVHKVYNPRHHADRWPVGP